MADSWYSGSKNQSVSSSAMFFEQELYYRCVHLVWNPHYNLVSGFCSIVIFCHVMQLP